jgi:thiol-disulfide isomerase/thioredoxin
MTLFVAVAHRQFPTVLLGAVLCALLMAAGGCATSCPGCGQKVCLTDTCLQHADRPVLIDFYAPDCPDCQKIDTAINSLAVEYDGQAIIQKVHVYQKPSVAEAHHVRRLPTVVLYVRGREAARWVGAKPTNVYRSAVEKSLRMMNVPERDPARDGLEEWSFRTPSDCGDGRCAVRPAGR